MKPRHAMFVSPTCVGVNWSVVPVVTYSPQVLGGVNCRGSGEGRCLDRIPHRRGDELMSDFSEAGGEKYSLQAWGELCEPIKQYPVDSYSQHACG